MIEPARSDRRKFLRGAGATLAAAVGVLVLPDAVAGATTSNQRLNSSTRPTGVPASRPASPSTPVHITCCADAHDCKHDCGSGQVRFYCTSVCPPFCTGCQAASPNCYSYSQPSC